MRLPALEKAYGVDATKPEGILHENPHVLFNDATPAHIKVNFWIEIVDVNGRVQFSAVHLQYGGNSFYGGRCPARMSEHTLGCVDFQLIGVLTKYVLD
jgi:hypothetical protein